MVSLLVPALDPTTIESALISSSSPSPTPLDEINEPKGRLNPRELSSTALLPHLAHLQNLESTLSITLHQIISDRSSIDDAHYRLRSLLPAIEAVEKDVNGVTVSTDVHNPSPLFSKSTASSNSNPEDSNEGLLERVRKVNLTAERVGGKVRRLDEEVQRVRLSSERLNQVIELKGSLEVLRSSIKNEEWEVASRACRRAMDIPTEVLEGGFAARVVPTSEDPSPPAQALQALRNSLLDVFQIQFANAAAAKDEMATSRFFRLWPVIGAEDQGLQAYGDFVVGLVRGRNMSVGKTSSPLYYTTHVTALFESIALIIDQHQPVVHKYYGKGRMTSVMARLQQEGDRVVVNLVEGWVEERKVSRMMTSIKFQKPRLLPQSTNQASISSQLSSTHLPSLPSAASSLINSSARRVVSNAIQGVTSSALATSNSQQVGTSSSGSIVEEDSGPDPREVDKLVAELSGIAGRWGLYRKFIWSRLKYNGEAPAEMVEGGAIIGEAAAEAEMLPLNPSESAIIGTESGCMKIIDSVMQEYYEPMEVWYLKTSIEKAMRLNTPDTSTRPHLSSSVDDTFYILKTILSRLISSSSLQALIRIIPKIETSIEKEYSGALRNKMEGVYAGTKSLTTGGQNQQGAPERNRMEREMRGSFIIHLNDLDVSADHMERLIQEISSSESMQQAYLTEELDQAKKTVKQLTSLAPKFRNILKNGLDQLFNQLTRPRLRSFLEECYKGVTYVLDEDSYAEAEFQDLVKKRFIRSWQSLIEGYFDTFTDNNYQLFFSMIVEVLVRPWEKMVMGMKFTELGALRFDRDIRSVANFLSSQTTFGGAREKFIRLQQIATVLNLDMEEDPMDFYANSSISWRLSAAEYQACIDLRA